MPSKFGGIPVDDQPRSKFGGVPVSEEAAPKGRGARQQAGHELSYGTRATLEGLTGVADIAIDPLARGLEYVTGQSMYRGRDIGRMASDALGLDNPETGSERIVSDVNRAVAGTVSGAGAARQIPQVAGPVMRGVRTFFGEGLPAQVAGAASGATATGYVRENGGSEAAQLGAGLGAGGLPALMRYGAPATIRALVRGGEDGLKRMRQNISDFHIAGAGTPSVGQATQRRINLAMESLFGRVPGSAGVMDQAAEAQAQRLGNGASRIADDIAPGADEVAAGQAIQIGITGPGGWRERFNAASGKAYDRVESVLPNGLRIPVNNTLNTLRQVAPDPHAAAPNVSARSINGELRGWRADFEKDAQPSSMWGQATPALPYEVVKNARTTVGKNAAANFGADASAGDWRTLYGALTRDMHDGASNFSPIARSRQERANNLYSAGKKREELISPIVNAGAPEDVFHAAIRNGDRGITRLSALYDSLPTEARNTTTSAVIRRLGIAKPGAQGAQGGEFSSHTFLTNWNALGGKTQQLLLSHLAPDQRAQVEAMARVADNLKRGSKVWANPSKSSDGVGQLATAGATAGAAATGNVGALASIIGTATGANLGAKAMTSPNVVRWLAERNRLPSNPFSYLLVSPQQKERKQPKNR